MDEPIITLEDLSIGYDNKALLSGISLSVARGSFTALLGAAPPSHPRMSW